MIKNKKKVIKTLEKNLLYEDPAYTHLDIDANMEEDFFKKYKFKDDGKNNFPRKISRDNYGNILLDEIPYLVSNLPSDGNFESHWVLLSNGSKILVKEIDYCMQLFELMFKGLCDQLGIACAEYDLVKTDKVYLASQSFLKTNEFLFDYYEFTGKAELKIIKSKIKKLEINDLVEKAKRINDTDRMLKTIFIDTITNHYDRFPYNYKIIKNNFGYFSSPLFDNGGCCESIEKFLYQRVSHNDSIEKEDILYKLLTYKEFFDWFIQNVDNINIEQIAENIYKRKHIYVDSCIYEDFDKTVSDGLYIAKSALYYK